MRDILKEYIEMCEQANVGRLISRGEK